MNRHTMLFYCIALSGFSWGSLWAVRIINVTEAPIYFAVYYKEKNQAIKYTAPEEIGYYTTLPNEIDFLNGSTYGEIPSFYLEWPSQKCESWFSGSCVSRYPSTVFFSFEMHDIKKRRVGFSGEGGSPSFYLGKDIGSALHQGWNIKDDRTYFVFYNPFGFDPTYAAHGKRDSDIKGKKLNACGVDAKIERSLRRYLTFARDLFFGL